VPTSTKTRGTSPCGRTFPYTPAPSLSLTEQGQVRYTLKTPWCDGTTHVIFEPLDFIARLAALVPKPRVNLTRYHGVFAPNSAHRALITPAGLGRGGKKAAETEEQTPTERHLAMTWAQRLKRVFNIDISTCPACGGALKVIACIEDPVVIRRILDHLNRTTPGHAPAALPQPRAPPQTGWLDSPDVNS